MKQWNHWTYLFHIQYGETTVPRLQSCIGCILITYAILTQYINMTDRHTHTHTHRQW